MPGSKDSNSSENIAQDEIILAETEEEREERETYSRYIDEIFSGKFRLIQKIGNNNAKGERSLMPGTSKEASKESVSLIKEPECLDIDGSEEDRSLKEKMLKNSQPKPPIVKPDPLTLLHLPTELLELILKKLSFETISGLRAVCQRFNSVCASLLNVEFTRLRTLMHQRFQRIKSQMPRRESSRRKHPLARESDIIENLHMRLSLLHMTFGKHIERNHCCFYAGEVLDEVYRIVRYIDMTPNLSRAYKVTDELFDLSTMAMEYFKERIEPGLPEITYFASDFLDYSPSIASSPRGHLSLFEESFIPKPATVVNVEPVELPVSPPINPAVSRNIKRLKDLFKKNNSHITNMKHAQNLSQKKTATLQKTVQLLKLRQSSFKKRVSTLTRQLNLAQQEISLCKSEVQYLRSAPAAHCSCHCVNAMVDDVCLSLNTEDDCHQCYIERKRKFSLSFDISQTNSAEPDCKRVLRSATKKMELSENNDIGSFKSSSKQSKSLTKKFSENSDKFKSSKSKSVPVGKDVLMSKHPSKNHTHHDTTKASQTPSRFHVMQPESASRKPTLCCHKTLYYCQNASEFLVNENSKNIEDPNMDDVLSDDTLPLKNNSSGSKLSTDQVDSIKDSALVVDGALLAEQGSSSHQPILFENSDCVPELSTTTVSTAVSLIAQNYSETSESKLLSNRTAFVCPIASASTVAFLSNPSVSSCNLRTISNLALSESNENHFVNKTCNSDVVVASRQVVKSTTAIDFYSAPCCSTSQIYQAPKCTSKCDIHSQDKVITTDPSIRVTPMDPNSICNASCKCEKLLPFQFRLIDSQRSSHKASDSDEYELCSSTNLKTHCNKFLCIPKMKTKLCQSNLTPSVLKSRPLSFKCENANTCKSSSILPKPCYSKSTILKPNSKSLKVEHQRSEIMKSKLVKFNSNNSDFGRSEPCNSKSLNDKSNSNPLIEYSSSKTLSINSQSTSVVRDHPFRSKSHIEVHKNEPCCFQSMEFISRSNTLSVKPCSSKSLAIKSPKVKPCSSKSLKTKSITESSADESSSSETFKPKFLNAMRQDENKLQAKKRNIKSLKARSSSSKFLKTKSITESSDDESSSSKSSKSKSLKTMQRGESNEGSAMQRILAKGKRPLKKTAKKSAENKCPQTFGGPNCDRYRGNERHGTSQDQKRHDLKPMNNKSTSNTKKNIFHIYNFDKDKDIKSESDDVCTRTYSVFETSDGDGGRLRDVSLEYKSEMLRIATRRSAELKSDFSTDEIPTLPPCPAALTNEVAQNQSNNANEDSTRNSENKPTPPPPKSPPPKSYFDSLF